MSEMCEFPVEDALEMIFIFGAAGIISYANGAARKKLGYEAQTGENGLAGRHMEEIFPNTFRASGAGFETRCLFGEETQHLVAYRRNLTCFPVEAKLISTRSGDYICMANDILEREHLGREIEQVREEAQQAAKVKAEFVANVTHELRTPVNGILGNVRELLGDVKEPRTMKSLRLIERCCGDMNKIIDNVLDFSKLDAGKFTLEPRRFHFRNMLDYVKEQHIGRITEKGLDFFMTVSPQAPEYIVGDELRIVQILNNLLSNALKFTSVGKITLQALKTARVDDKTELFFIVSDTGIGIAEEDRDKLFRSFSQVDASISRKYGGTGLGLNICRQLVELMGGSIEVESRRGRGSVFSFSIWVGACEEAEDSRISDDRVTADLFAVGQGEDSGNEPDDTKNYGSEKNREALGRNLSKLILCVEMENWEKAEMFMETVRQLTEEVPPEIKRMALKLKMAIQKENYDRVIMEYDKLITGLGLS
ncbi:ATP-binding protein [Acetatifactor muris]|jgi:PAS domain S-box-containing protein|uniref:Circadian input-output histidine kinase CikA n=1 Tax=Acetatifactor muris TaxID=879566 RepID=A0A2K4ZF06_9FIRM|nr:ATP-binding protein [Acetatifactor muris]MCR2047242.1 ATP-binding protein [Acetatifactor muris]SOY29047.1 Signal transduction histidine-protein kinase BarA [Acetatifactor muris]